MDGFLTGAGMIMLFLIGPILYRVMAGPTAIDRIVAVNMIGTKTTVLLVIIGTLFHRVDMFVDFAITYALLNFIGSLAAAKYFHRMKLKKDGAGPVLEVEKA